AFAWLQVPDGVGGVVEVVQVRPAKRDADYRELQHTDLAFGRALSWSDRKLLGRALGHGVGVGDKARWKVDIDVVNRAIDAARTRSRTGVTAFHSRERHVGRAVG